HHVCTALGAPNKGALIGDRAANRKPGPRFEVPREHISTAVRNVTIKCGNHQLALAMGHEGRGNPTSVGKSLTKLILQEFVAGIEGQTLRPILTRKAGRDGHVSREIKGKGLSTSGTCRDDGSQRTIVITQAQNSLGCPNLEFRQLSLILRSGAHERADDALRERRKSAVSPHPIEQSRGW